MKRVRVTIVATKKQWVLHKNERNFVDLYNQYEMRMCQIVICGLSCGGAESWGNGLLVRRSQVRFLMVSLDFFLLNPSGPTLSLVSILSLIEMSAKSISWE